MEKRNLLKQCRYYKGQDTNPFTDSDIAWFWDMERVYVEQNGKFIGEEEVYRSLHGKEYAAIPHNLLMVMFTSWAKYETDLKNRLNAFYKLMELYLDFVSDHFPKDRVPD